MDNSIYVGLSRQMVLQRELDVVANNVANVDTVGFKVESLMVQTQPERLASDASVSPVVNYVLDAGLVRNFTQGSMKQTGSSLDVAIDGDGFFKVSTPSGERYTRDGRFGIDPQGRLVTQSGQPVQGDGGDITVDPDKGPVKIAADGTVSQQTSIIGRLSVVNFPSLSALSKDGDGLYSNVSNLQPQAATTARVRQGMLETSNVEPMSQITKLIQVSRAYESITQMVAQTADLSKQAVERLGRLS